MLQPFNPSWVGAGRPGCGWWMGGAGQDLWRPQLL